MIIEKGSCCVPEVYYYHSGNEGTIITAMIIEKESCCVPEGYYYHSGNEP